MRLSICRRSESAGPLAAKHASPLIVPAPTGILERYSHEFIARLGGCQHRATNRNRLSADGQQIQSLELEQICSPNVEISATVGLARRV
jgi:hypothetical protein